MPSRDGQPYEPILAPPPLHASQKVWVCRFTGALFGSYEDYLKQLGIYRQRVWSCKHTGKASLCYEEALTEEAKCQGLLEQFPDCYEGPVTKLLHHATLKLEDLCQRLVSYFKDRYVPGEVVLGRRDGFETACRVTAAVDPVDLELDSQALSTAIIPPDPEDEYQIEWLSDGETAVLKRYELARKRVPLTRTVLKSWLPLAAEAETVAGVKGIPCIWRATAELCERYGLTPEAPASLRERIERAQQRREQQSRRSSQADQDFIQMDAGEIDDQDDEDYEENAAPTRTAERRPDAKRTVPVEPLAKTRERFKAGTVKRVLFDALEDAGEGGLSIAALVDAVQAAGVKTWAGSRSANSSIAATCTHDLAFLRVGPGQIALRALKQDTMQVPVSSAAAAREKSEEHPAPVARSPGFERNNFKCPRCHRSVHPDSSPLVLCDSCPRSFHLACLDLAFEELPEDEWECPKCQDRRAGAGRRLASSYSRGDAFDRLSYGDADGRGGERRRDDDRARDDPRFARERAREAAKWAALHPLDDLEMLDDEEEALAALETEAQLAGEEAARAERRAEGKPEGPATDRVARLQRRAKRLAEQAADLRLVIDGPQPAEAGVTTDAARTALYDALSIVDFLTIFGASFDAAPLSLLEVQQAAAFPLDTDHLPQLYTALLRCLLIEAMAMEGVVRSRAKRWGRVIDDATWPEVLRRYLLASRAGLPVPEGIAAAGAAVDAAGLDDHAACIIAAKLLSEMPYHRLGAGLHLRILTALCNDVTECTTLRNEISARVEEMHHIQTEFRQKQNEDRKRQKEEATGKLTIAEESRQQLPDDAGAAEAPAEPEGEGGEEANAEGSAEGEEGEAPEPAGEPGKTGADANETEGADKEGEAADPGAAPADAPPEQPAAGEVEGQPGAAQADQPAAEAATPEPPKPSFELPDELKDYKGSKRDKKELNAWKTRRSEEIERLAKEKSAWDRQQKERRRKRQGLAAEKKQAKAAQAQAAANAERDYEEELKGREAALDEAMDARAIRGEALGQDRHFRRYWWYPGEQSAVFVEEADGAAIAVLDAPEQLEALMERLNRNGLREKALHYNLNKRRDMILNTLGYHAVNLDVATAPRPNPEKEAAAVAGELDDAAVRGALARLTGFLDDLDAIPAAPVTRSVAEWRARLEGVAERADLASAIIDLEADVNGLGSGLPTGADDASLAGFGKARKIRAAAERGGGEDDDPSDAADAKVEAGGAGSEEAPLAPPDIKAEVESEPQPLKLPTPLPEAKIEAGPPLPNGVAASLVPVESMSAPSGNDLHAAPNAPGAATDVRAAAEDGKGDAEDSTILDAATIAEETDAKSEAEERFDETLTAVECVERLFKDSDYEMPISHVNPPDELDASDSEASKNRRGGTLWRSARERKAWLKDARRALHCFDASVVAYVAAVLVDRAQPLLRSLIRATKRAEKEAAEWEAIEAAAAAAAATAATGVAPSSNEGTPQPAPAAAARAPAKGKRSKRGAETARPRLSEGPASKRPRTSMKQATAAAATADDDDDSEATETDDDAPAGRWSSTCQVCGGEGELLGCEQLQLPDALSDESQACLTVRMHHQAPECRTAQHVACAGLDEPPADEWYCAEHRNKPSAKRRRARSAARDVPSLPRQSVESQASPPRKGKVGRASAENGTLRKSASKKRKR